MAKGKKTGGKNFEVGNTYGGRKALPDDIKAARNLSYEEMCRTVIDVRNLTPAQVRSMNLEEEPLGKRAIINAYVKMDYRGIVEYENRLWGKAREHIDLNTEKDRFDDLFEEFRKIE